MSTRLFDTVLIANRSEIACRVIATCRRLGIRTVAVYSDADANARHVRLADTAVHIGAAPARESYLVAERILAAARATGAQAIHPGYGFLSENADFADACAAAGIVFIGPPASAIRAMGSKSAAKAMMGAAGVPLTPGYHGDDQRPAFLREQADAIGYPVLIKASAGGGGKGMRLVERSEDFEAALASCQREAASSFNDQHVLVEKYVLRPRHIEIQVFGDSHGNVVHLFERDCSVQRRHQKVLEEAPAPGMTPERRAAMGAAAVEAARAVGYVGAGTVEFIASQDGAFYFMEMNTRLQVEHPVTEMITMQDLVEWQLRVAAGGALPLSQDELTIDGHAIEARIYAEDPEGGFLPSTGTLQHLSFPPASEHVRVDTGVEQGDAIAPFYDPMIAKLIVWDSTRERALQRMAGALAQVRVVGVRSNVGFLERLVRSEPFATADLDTGLIARHHDALFPAIASPDDAAWALAALALLLRDRGAGSHGLDTDAVGAQRHGDSLSPARAGASTSSPWDIRDGWRLNGVLVSHVTLSIGDERRDVRATHSADGFALSLGTSTWQARGTLHAGRLQAVLGERRIDAGVVFVPDRLHLFVDDARFVFDVIDPLAHAGEHDAQHGGLVAPMPGRIVALLAAPGARVERGAPLLVMEAMKMEHTVAAPAAGVVKGFFAAVGEQVADGATLVDFEADAD
ncbi:acetyl/propionyl/methylcrotonyl-CoA carboxylase subunit alpha [Chiayiivirga flava]|uniref:Biotin carboxylase n=1 Tax=Chiayiivirga flava TaxID=659595 RepID=A0A7W8D6B2_9GAMM|nr:acetyl-CoA carboxylase biotin carboxylase subunit [Chiayiivirga flava]MBB5207526.1 3-methylcrotonyl-CoA carboxylase alpha subunit [Chiayiivirga flava]